jgi:hypothetical protein
MVDTSRNTKTKVLNKAMSAKHRGRSSDVCERNQNGLSEYPEIQTVCKRVNYWKHKHKKTTYI